MRNSRTLLLALAIFSIVFVLGELLFVPKTYVNSGIVQALQAPAAFFRSLANQHGLIQDLTATQLENQSLRAQLAAAESRPGIVKIAKTDYLQAAVYSIYPLNTSGSMLIAAGSSEGVREGMIVVAAPDVFVGEVTKTYKHQSEVRTLYDLGWELPVKIGANKIDSLLVGGHQPRLTLISKKKPATAGMSVYLASSKYPYGLLLGSMGDPAGSDKNLFQEAPLVFPYVLGDLSSVYVRLGE